jgi:predicted dehydrogenase
MKAPHPDSVGIGVIGCGVISGAYLTAAKGFPILDIRGLADMNPAAAEARAREFGLKAVAVDALLADPTIEIVLNLTIPKAHVAVGLRALDAGKHVYSEKPLGVVFKDGKKLIDRAAQTKLRVGSAPDTFLGGAHQTCRKLIDAGKIGTPVGGTATFMCPGHERWHPAPDFYYQAGGGPVLDMAPYYVTDLVNLLGPVARVSAMTSMPKKTRVITSQPRRGENIPVEVPTHAAGVLEFVSGALVQMSMSFDVPAHRHLPIEIYGSKGSLIVPDPNRFGGEIEFAAEKDKWVPLKTDMPYADGNYRSIGLADMAHALRSKRPHRASGALALHVLEVMEAFDRSAKSGKAVPISTRPERPAPLEESLVRRKLAA